MSDDKTFYTLTMAKVYAAQGYLNKAARIYHYLLQQSPDRQDLLDAVEDLEKRAAEKMKYQKEDLVSRISLWIDLLLKYNNLKKIKRLTR